MKIAIGMHIDTAVLPSIYFNHISTIGIWNKNHDLTVVGTWKEKVAAARNHIVDGALSEKCSHLLLIDSDHLVPDELLDLLVENADAAVVSGLICKRYYPYDTVAFKCMPDGELQQCVIETRGKVIEVDACAMGCTLINLNIIAKWLKEGKLTAPVFHDRGKFRSDLNFFLDVRKLGGRILLDTRVEIGHMSDPLIVTPKNAQMLRERYLFLRNKGAGEDIN